MLHGILSRNFSNNSNPSTFGICKDHQESLYAWAFFITLSFPLGFPASIAILWEMFKSYRKGSPFTPNDFFVLNLSVMDAIFLVFIPPGLLNIFIWHSWSFYKSWNCVHALVICGRPLLMACVCLDCYLAVVHPITFHKRKSLTPRVVMAGIVWILTVASGIAYFLFPSLYFTVFSIVPYIIAVVTIGICDCLILYSLIKSDPGKETIHPQKQRAAQILINSLVMTVLFYLPPILVFGVGRPLSSNIHALICTIAIPMTITSSLGSAVMPLLHLRNRGKLDCFNLGCCRKS